MPLYIDIGVGVIMVIAFIVGIIKGFAKQFTKGFCGFIGLIGSIALTIIIIPALQKAGTLGSFANVAAGWFSGEQFTTVVSGEEDIVALLSTGVMKILSGLSPRIWNSMQIYGMNTLGAYFGDLLARFITGILLWIVLLIAIKFIFLGIRKLLEKMAKLPVLKTLDRIFGALWALLIAYVIVVIFITTAIEVVIIKWIPSMYPTLSDIVNGSTLFNVLHDTNIVGAYIAKLLGVDLSVLTAA